MKYAAAHNHWQPWEMERHEITVIPDRAACCRLGVAPRELLAPAAPSPGVWSGAVGGRTPFVQPKPRESVHAAKAITRFPDSVQRRWTNVELPNTPTTFICTGQPSLCYT